MSLTPRITSGSAVRRTVTLVPPPRLVHLPNGSIFAAVRARLMVAVAPSSDQAASMGAPCLRNRCAVMWSPRLTGPTSTASESSLRVAAKAGYRGVSCSLPVSARSRAVPGA